MTEKTAGIYVASSIYDKPLQDSYTFIKEEIVLQVGAALTAKRISPKAVADCEEKVFPTGINSSASLQDFTGFGKMPVKTMSDWCITEDIFSCRIIGRNGWRPTVST